MFLNPTTLKAKDKFRKEIDGKLRHFYPKENLQINVLNYQ